jgi:hypothetical protein
MHKIFFTLLILFYQYLKAQKLQSYVFNIQLIVVTRPNKNTLFLIG